MNKYIILLSFDQSLGGAQIRYLSLFKEITQRKNDYLLVINSQLYDIAIKADLINAEVQNIIILDKYLIILESPQKSSLKSATKNKIKNNYFFRKISKLRNQLISLKKLIKYAYKLHKVFKSTQPDYVYAIWTGGMIAWPLKYFYRFKLVYSYMDSGFSSIYNGLDNPLKNERLALKKSDVIDFLSNDLFLGVSRRITLNKRTKIAISPCSFKNYNNLYPVYPKANAVTFCSRMTHIKNPLLLLASIVNFNKLTEDFGVITFQFIGDGESVEQMKLFKEKNQLSNVEILGNIENPCKYLQRSKIFVSIQQSNNYPSQSLLEAMACGNAIIASDVGETRKLVTENEGVLVKLDANNIAAALLYLIENNEECISLGKNARAKVLKEHTIDNYLEYFYSLETK